MPATLLTMLAAALLGLSAGGCTEVVGSDVDDVDAQMELEQSTDGIDVASDQSLIQDATRAHGDDGADNEDPFAPAAEKQSQGLDFHDILNVDPEPAPWVPKEGNDT